MALAESHIPLNTRTLGQLLVARRKREQIETYRSHMVYLLAKKHYKGITPPQDFERSVMEIRRKAVPDGNIIDSIRKKLLSQL